MKVQKSKGVMLIIVVISFFHTVLNSGCKQINSEMLYEWETVAFV